MYEIFRHGAGKLGDAPGTPRYVGPPKDFAPRAETMIYGPDGFESFPDDLTTPPAPGEGQSMWVRVIGLHDVELVRRACELLGAGPLLQEDIANTGQRPKLEESERFSFVTLKALTISSDGQVLVEQLALLWDDNVLVSFQEGETAPWDTVLPRLRRSGRRIRTAGSEYAAAALLDAVVDGYVQALGVLSEDVAALEAGLSEAMDENDLLAVYRLRRHVLTVRTWLWPLREVLARLERGFDVKADARLFLRDVSDHLTQVLEAGMALFDILAGIIELQAALTGMRTNRVMQVLTIIATIFIPLTFIAGVYGMNFEYMPELHWRWGYFGVLGLMGVVGVGMYLYFSRKGWF